MQETITIRGTEYALRNPGHMALMKTAREFIVRDRPNPLIEAAQAIAGLPEDLSAGARAAMAEDIRTIAERAMLARNRVTAQDIGNFLQTREGIIFAFWQFCPAAQTFDRAAELVEAMCDEMGEHVATEILQAKIDTASDLVEAKNSSGPARNGPGRGEANPD